MTMVVEMGGKGKALERFRSYGCEIRGMLVSGRAGTATWVQDRELSPRPCEACDLLPEEL